MNEVILVGDFKVDTARVNDQLYENMMLVESWLQESRNMGLDYGHTQHVVVSLANDKVKSTLSHVFGTEELFKSMIYAL